MQEGRGEVIMAKEFLIELGTEELPPTQLRTLAESFASNFEAELKAAELSHEGVKWFAAPRRLAPLYPG